MGDRKIPYIPFWEGIYITDGPSAAPISEQSKGRKRKINALGVGFATV
jgi:hypothetical protein